MSPIFISAVRRIFKLLYITTIVVAIWGGYVLLTEKQVSLTVLQVGRYFGQASLVLFCITLLPGIFLRFKLKVRAIERIRPFRGNTGILMYFCAITHYLLIRFFLSLKAGNLFLWPSLFEGFGITALLFTLPLFITANSYSIKRLRQWWKKIHALVYVVVWFIAFHVLLGESALWLKFLIALTAVSELLSLIYAGMKKGGVSKSPSGTLQ